MINIHLLLPLIQKAELSRNEVQVLTDLLLTKHLDEVSDRFEWTEVSKKNYYNFFLNALDSLYSFKTHFRADKIL